MGPPNSGKTKIINDYVAYKRDTLVSRTSDIERIRFLYNGAQIDVEIWDTVGLEKYDENFIYSQNYV